jgi:hypothetical protein
MVHDFVKQVDSLKADLRSFLVSPKRWRTSRVTVALAWTFVSFSRLNRAHVPKDAGAYAFIVRHVNDHFPAHGFIMYLGITGSAANERTLYDRYSDYLREKKINKRPKVHYMLNKYANDLHFAYCVPPPEVT